MKRRRTSSDTSSPGRLANKAERNHRLVNVARKAERTRRIELTPLSKLAFVVTLAWAVAVGLLVPAVVVGILFGKVLGWIVGVIGAVLGYLVHRYAWSDVTA